MFPTLHENEQLILVSSAAFTSGENTSGESLLSEHAVPHAWKDLAPPARSWAGGFGPHN